MTEIKEGAHRSDGTGRVSSGMRPSKPPSPSKRPSAMTDGEIAWQAATEATTAVFGHTKGFWAKTFWFFCFDAALTSIAKQKKAEAKA